MFHPLISRACIWTSLTVLVALLLTIGLAYASAPAVHAQEVLPNPIRLLDDTTGGDCTLVGTWDAGSKTCTLTQDIGVRIEIGNGTAGAADGLALDGGNHKVEQPNNSNTGIRVNRVDGLLVKNVI